MPTVALQALLLCFISVISCQDVHMGDIKLIPCQNDTNCKTNAQVIGTLMIYYGSEKEAPSWRPVCNDGVHDRDWKTSIAICNMLGYALGQPLSLEKIKTMKFIMPRDYALTQLDCTKDMSNGEPPSHLLRCSYKFHDDSVCGRPIILKCSEPKGQPLMLKKYVPYNGQVQLCPPDEIIADPTYPARQVSFGIVATYLNSFWGSLNENSSSMVGYDQTNTVCKQLGFTGAVRDSTRTVSSYTGQYTFTNCLLPRKDESGLQRAWLTVPQTSRCNSNPCSCFSCCYEQPKDGNQCSIAELQADGQCPRGHCCRENDVVIECTFDKASSSPPLSGTKDACAFEDGQKLLSLSSTGCTQQLSTGVSYSQQQFLAGVLVPTVALVFVLGVLLRFVCRKYKKCNPEYQQLQEMNGEGGGGGDGVHEQGN